MEAVLQRPPSLVLFLRLPGAEGLRDLDRFEVGVAEGDHAVVGAGRLDDVIDLVRVAADLTHRFANHAADAVFEVGHAGHDCERHALRIATGRRRGASGGWGRGPQTPFRLAQPSAEATASQASTIT